MDWTLVFAFVLLTALVISNIAWMIHSQRLVNKIMSRNYHEYEMTRAQAASLSNPRAKTAKGKPKEKPETFDHPQEDLRVVGEFAL
jgi:hypothetical protein